jgi:hypothetical protein
MVIENQTGWDIGCGFAIDGFARKKPPFRFLTVVDFCGTGNQIVYANTKRSRFDHFSHVIRHHAAAS